MPRDIGRLLPADEGLNHQLVDTFATVASADLSWTEKIWTTIARKDGSLQVDVGLGKYPNRNVMDGFGGISRGSEQWTVRASRELASAPEDAQVGPIGYEVVEPLSKVRFTLADNDVLPLRLDLTFEKRFPAVFEGRHVSRAQFRESQNVIRYHQAGTVSGWIDIDGERIDVRPEEWFAFRDHSWGVRGGVGVRPSDLPPFGTREQLLGGERPTVFHMNWIPVLFERPDGSRYATHWYFTQAGGVSSHFTGFVNHEDGTQEPIVRVVPDLKYEPPLNYLAGGRVTLVTASGEERVLDIEPISDTGFHLLTGGYGQWKDVLHGVWRGELAVDGERIDDFDTIPEAQQGQLRDRPVRVRDGDATGYGILESIVFGDLAQIGPVT